MLISIFLLSSSTMFIDIAYLCYLLKMYDIIKNSNMIVQTGKVFHGFLTICHFIYYRFFYNIISKFKREKFYHHHIIIFKLVHDDSFNGSFWIFLNLFSCIHFIVIYFWIDNIMKNIQAIFSTYIKLLSWITSMSILSKMPHLDSPWHVIWYLAIEF